MPYIHTTIIQLSRLSLNRNTSYRFLNPKLYVCNLKVDKIISFLHNAENAEDINPAFMFHFIDFSFMNLRQYLSYMISGMSMLCLIPITSQFNTLRFSVLGLCGCVASSWAEISHREILCWIPLLVTWLTCNWYVPQEYEKTCKTQ